jgi:glycerol-3-phosphate acyltransferase PlsY
MSLLTVTIALLGYLVGCLNAGYYYVRIFHGKDLRLLGTGTAGARNAGRVFGPWTFFLVFWVDCAKGAALTALGLRFGLDYAAVAAVAVVAGHIWPMQLQFQGGKGVASALGAMLLLAPGLLLWVAFGCGVFKLLGYTLVRAGMLGFWLAAVGAMRSEPLPVVTATTLLALLLTISHRHNLWRKT